jgi:hypothetical protein
LDKEYTYSYGNYATKQDGAATMSKSGASELTATYTSSNKAGTHSQKVQDEENELLMALRDQGIKIGVKSVWDKGAGAGAGAEKESVRAFLAQQKLLARLGRP